MCFFSYIQQTWPFKPFFSSPFETGMQILFSSPSPVLTLCCFVYLQKKLLMESRIMTSWPSLHLLHLHGAVTCQGQDWPQRDQEMSSIQPEKRLLLSRFSDSYSRQSDSFLMRCWQRDKTQAWAYKPQKLRQSYVLESYWNCSPGCTSVRTNEQVRLDQFCLQESCCSYLLTMQQASHRLLSFRVVRRLKQKKKEACLKQMGKIRSDLRVFLQKSCKLVSLGLFTPSVLGKEVLGSPI